MRSCFAILEHLHSPCFGVLFSFTLHVCFVQIAVMQQRAGQSSGCAFKYHAFVHHVVRKPPLGSVKQPQHVIRIPTRVPDETSAKLRESWHVKSISATIFHRFDELRLKIVSHPLISIYSKHPLVSRVRQGAVLLYTEARPIMHLNLRSQLTTNLHRRIAAAGINNDDFIRPRYRFKTSTDVSGFIFCNDDNGKFITNDLPSVFRVPVQKFFGCWVSQMASSHISGFISSCISHAVSQL